MLPLGDLAVLTGVEQVYNDGAALSRGETREIAESWRPYRSYGTRYIRAAYESRMVAPGSTVDQSIVPAARF